MLEIVSTPFGELDPAKRQFLLSTIESEFGDFEIVRETEWATPDWTFLGIRNSEVVCFYSVVSRTVSLDDQLVPIAGLNNLITLPNFRGEGIASELLQQTIQTWPQIFPAKLGLLLCADELLPFYQRHGWRQVEAPVQFAQPQGVQDWQANCMLFPLDDSPLCDSQFTPRKIDLCGLPW